MSAKKITFDSLKEVQMKDVGEHPEEEMVMSEETTPNQLPTDYPKKEDIKVATMTLISKINCFVDTQRIVDAVTLEAGKIEGIHFGSKKDVGKKNIVAAKEKTDRKNKKTKKHFYNQVTILIKPEPTRSKPVNMKISKNGSIQMTGCRSMEEGHATIRKMLEVVFANDTTIFYRTRNINTGLFVDDLASTVTTTVDEENTVDTAVELQRSHLEKVLLTGEDIPEVQIMFMKCELIIVSFQLPFFVHLEKFNRILQEKYKLLSIWQTSSYPGINTKITYSKDCHETEHVKKKKYMCNCRDMSIFTFRTGKVIITGFEKIEKIHDVYEQYLEIVKAERPNVYLEPMLPKQPVVSKGKPRAPRGSKKKPVVQEECEESDDAEIDNLDFKKIMRVGGKVFVVVDEFSD